MSHKPQSEYERLKAQKDAIIEKHMNTPGSKCPFGCPHDKEPLRLKYEGSQSALTKAMSELADVRAELAREREGREASNKSYAREMSEGYERQLASLRATVKAMGDEIKRGEMPGGHLCGYARSFHAQSNDMIALRATVKALSENESHLRQLLRKAVAACGGPDDLWEGVPDEQHRKIADFFVRFSRTVKALGEAINRIVAVVHENCDEKCGDESTCADVKQIAREVAAIASLAPSAETEKPKPCSCPVKVTWKQGSIVVPCSKCGGESWGAEAAKPEEKP